MSQSFGADSSTMMLIGMFVVFAAFLVLSRILRKAHQPDTAPVPLAQTASPAIAPVSAAEDDDAEVAAAIAAALACYGYQSDETIAVIAAALACYGYLPGQIVAVRPVGGRDWAKLARVEGVSIRNQMF